MTNTIANIIAGILIKAAMGIMQKIATQGGFETIARVWLFAMLDKLTPMTTNTLDDKIVAEIKRRMTPPDIPAPPPM